MSAGAHAHTPTGGGFVSLPKEMLCGQEGKGRVGKEFEPTFKHVPNLLLTTKLTSTNNKYKNNT